MSRWRPVVGLAALASIGCGDRVAMPGTDEDATGAAATFDESDAGGPVDTAAPPDRDDDDDDDDDDASDTTGGSDDDDDDAMGGSGGGDDANEDPGCSFTCPNPPPPPPGTNPGGGGQCSLALQNCPEGEKCMPWANDGGQLWNSSRCAPVADDAAELDEPCTVEGSGVSGIDNCALGLACFNVDAETNEGICLQLCGAVEGAPVCPSGTACADYGGGIMSICRDPCDPLDQAACLPGMECFPAGNPSEDRPAFFACYTHPLSERDGFYADSFHAVCERAEMAVPLDEALCDETGCCTPLCRIDEADCPDGLVCNPYLDPAPPSLANVGVCETG